MKKLFAALLLAAPVFALIPAKADLEGQYDPDRGTCVYWYVRSVKHFPICVDKSGWIYPAEMWGGEKDSAYSEGKVGYTTTNRNRPGYTYTKRQTKADSDWSTLTIYSCETDFQKQCSGRVSKLVYKYVGNLQDYLNWRKPYDDAQRSKREEESRRKYEQLRESARGGFWWSDLKPK